MTYDEAQGEDVTQAQALAEVEDHGIDLTEFFEDMGDRAYYEGSEVLSWLGY